MDERRRKALKTLLGVGAISSLVGASILTTNLLTQRHVEVVEQIINRTIVQQPINQTQVTEQVQQYNTYTTNYWDADAVVYTKNSNYYAVSHDGTTICTGSPTSCIQEVINYLYNTKGSGKIYIRTGTYYINQNVVFPWHNGEDVIIEGEGMDRTIIQINAPNTVQSYSAATGQYIGAAQWLNLFLRDLGINVVGDYSSFTGGIFNMYQVWAKLDNVMLSGSYLKTQTLTSIFSFGGSGAPGKSAVWTNVYAGFQVGEVIGSSGGVYGINLSYEGFDWIGGGVSLNVPAQSGRFVPLSLSGGANTRVRLVSLPLYISPATVSSSLFAYIQFSGSEIELVDVELPETSYSAVGCQISTSQGSVAIVRRTIIHEGGPQTVPVVCNGFVYQEGMLLKQTVSVPVGTNGNYGSAVNINVAYANIVGITISVSNVASGETISVELTMVYADGSTTSETLTFSSSTTYTLGLNDYLNLANTSGVPKKYLQVQASSNLSSTSATVTVEVVTQ
jgi:hypothetical protein